MRIEINSTPGPVPFTTSKVGFHTIRLDEMRRGVRDDEHKRFRQDSVANLLAECEKERLSWPQRAARLVDQMCESKGQQHVIESDERSSIRKLLELQQSKIHMW